MSKKVKKENTKIEKIIPSKLENIFCKFVYNTFGKIVPETITPNQMTFIGAFGGLLGIVCAMLSKIHLFFLIGTIIGLLIHLICDDLDGYIARKRNMSSDAGAFFDLLTDILHVTYLLIAFSLAGITSFEITIFLVPVYALMMFTAMNYIRYLNEFLFPRLGPIETHLLLILLCLLTMIFGIEPILEVAHIKLKVADIIFIVGGIPMYYEMIRLQIQLFRRLHVKNNDKK